MIIPLPVDNLRNRLIISVGALLILVGVAGFFLVKKYQHDIIEQQALTVAEIVAKQAIASRSAYSESVVGSLIFDAQAIADFHFHEKSDDLLSPSQFIKKLAQDASSESEGMFEYRAVSKWNLGLTQGLNNRFLQTAWEELEKQDQADPVEPIVWQSSHAIIDDDGQAALYFAKADSATSQSCIDCHNAYEKSPLIKQRRVQQGLEVGRTWKKHQLLGAFFVKIPLSKMQSLAIEKSTKSILWIMLVLTAGLVALAYFLVGDVTRANKKTRQLFWQARHDALTQLPNRFRFEEKTEELIQHAKSTGRSHFMCYMDLDRFQVVNDSCGHAVGDELLCQIAGVLGETLEPADMLARLGGDEFGVLFKNCPEARAIQVADELCQQVKRFPFMHKDQVFDIGVSVGLVEINDQIQSLEQVFVHADIACYAAKDAGRNRVQVYQENNAEIVLQSHGMSWISRILVALEKQQFVLFAQKISAVAENSDHLHFEVLIRLMDVNGNIILPGSFLPAAERYDMMTKIDMYVVEHAFRALKNKLFSGLRDSDFISINLSGQSLSDEKCLDKVIALIDQYAINPHQVCFEITETAVIKNPKLVRHFMFALKERAVRFALDDFGTGLSSLNYLKQFPVDYLKIDGSFIKDMIADSVDQTLVNAINQLAHTMQIKTIAEYVENQEILGLLREMGVDYAQGTFICEPYLIEQRSQ